jgi:hypothetical protein
MDKYYDDLGNVEDKLNRIKSEKYTRQKRDDSRHSPAGGDSAIPCMPHKTGTASRHLVIDKPYRLPSKENDGYAKTNNARIRIDSRHERDPSFIDTNVSVLMKRATDLTTIESTKLEDSEYTRLRAQLGVPERRIVESESETVNDYNHTRKISMLAKQNHPAPVKLTEE